MVFCTGMHKSETSSTDQSRSSQVAGFGLGVSVCWLLVELFRHGAEQSLQVNQILVFAALSVVAGACSHFIAGPLLVLGSVVGGGRPKAAAIPAAILLTVVSKTSLFELFQGDWVSQQAWQPAARFGSVVVLFLVSLWGGGFVLQKLRRARGNRLIFGFMFIFGCALCFYLDGHRFLVRKYPAAHDLLAIFGLLSSGIAGCLILPLKYRPTGLTQLVLGAFIVGLSWSGFVDVNSGFIRTTILRDGRLSSRAFRPFLDVSLNDTVGVDEELLASLEAQRPVDVELMDRLFPGRTRMSIVLITIDTLRYDALSCMGGSAKTPNLDRFIEDSLLFSNTWSQFPATRYAVNSFFAGQYPSSVNLDDENDEKVGQARLAESLLNQGYSTRALTSFPESLFELERKQLIRGFGEFENDEGETISKSARVVAKAKQALAEIEKTSTPNFLWLHLFDPHGPYHDRGGKVDGATSRERYDGEVEHIDSCLGAFLEACRKLPDPPLVIVHSDHGEEFEDHGGQGHNSNLYEEQIRVPLAIYLPGIKPGVCQHPVELIDLPATVREFVGLPKAAGDSGHSLMPILSGLPEADWPAPYCLSQFRWPRFVHGDLDAVRDSRWKLIHNRGLNLFELFDLENDPKESKDQSEAQPDELRRMRVALKTMREHAGALPEIVRTPETDRSLLAKAAVGQLDDQDKSTLLQILREENSEHGQAIVALLDSKDVETRHAALFHVLGFQLPAGRQFLRRRISDPSHPLLIESTVALAILGEGKGHNSQPFLTDAFTGPRRLVPLLARYLAGDSDLGPAIHQMLAQEGDDHDLETMAIRVLLRHKDVDFLPSLYSRSSRHITRAEQSAAIAQVADYFPFELASPFLRRFLKSSDMGMRARIYAIVSDKPEGVAWLKAAGEAESLAITARALGAQGGETDRSMALFKQSMALMSKAGFLDYGLAIEVSFYLNTWARRTDVIPLLEPLLINRNGAADKPKEVILSLLTVAKTYGRNFLGEIELLPHQAPRKNEHGQTPLLVRVTLQQKSAAMVGGYGPETEYLGAVLLGPKGERLSEPATWLLPNVGVLPGQSLILAAPVNFPASVKGAFKIGIRLGRANLDLVKPLALDVVR
ncbi:MAG: arylsulfatase A-like enzyme [Planctomycetota bacterium]|jgi:arylsulfatase A-like enzyme